MERLKFFVFALTIVCNVKLGFADFLESNNDQNAIQKGHEDGNQAAMNKKSRTLYDYQTRVVAYKDLIDSKCLLEILNGGESLISLKISDANDNNRDSLSKSFVTSSELSKRQIWRLAGQRITEFCRGFPTYLIKDTVVDDQNVDVSYMLNDLPIADDFSKKRIKRQSNDYFAGKARGQTQSQYLSFGQNGEPGKAEAESSYNGTRAVVTGTNGIGQAQSQSSPFGCEECLGAGFQDQTLQYGGGRTRPRPPDAQTRYPAANQITPGGYIPSGDASFPQGPGGRPNGQATGADERFPQGPGVRMPGVDHGFPQGADGRLQGHGARAPDAGAQFPREPSVDDRFPQGPGGRVPAVNGQFPQGTGRRVSDVDETFPQGPGGRVPAVDERFPQGPGGRVSAVDERFPQSPGGGAPAADRQYPQGPGGRVPGVDERFPQRPAGQVPGVDETYPQVPGGRVAPADGRFPEGPGGRVAGADIRFPQGSGGRVPAVDESFPQGAGGQVTGADRQFPQGPGRQVPDVDQRFPQGPGGRVPGVDERFPQGAGGRVPDQDIRFPQGSGGRIPVADRFPPEANGRLPSDVNDRYPQTPGGLIPSVDRRFPQEPGRMVPDAGARFPEGHGGSLPDTNRRFPHGGAGDRDSYAGPGGGRFGGELSGDYQSNVGHSGRFYGTFQGQYEETARHGKDQYGRPDSGTATGKYDGPGTQYEVPDRGYVGGQPKRTWIPDHKIPAADGAQGAGGDARGKFPAPYTGKEPWIPGQDYEGTGRAPGQDYGGTGRAPVQNFRGTGGDTGQYNGRNRADQNYVGTGGTHGPDYGRTAGIPPQNYGRTSGAPGQDYGRTGGAPRQDFGRANGAPGQDYGRTGEVPPQNYDEISGAPGQDYGRTGGVPPQTYEGTARAPGQDYGRTGGVPPQNYDGTGWAPGPDYGRTGGFPPQTYEGTGRAPGRDYGRSGAAPDQNYGGTGRAPGQDYGRTGGVPPQIDGGTGRAPGQGYGRTEGVPPQNYEGTGRAPGRDYGGTGGVPPQIDGGTGRAPVQDYGRLGGTPDQNYGGTRGTTGQDYGATGGARDRNYGGSGGVLDQTNVITGQGGYADGVGSGRIPGGGYDQNRPDDSDSQAQTSVHQTDNETLANAQAQGKYAGGTAQSQVSGTYTGSGSFSASAGSDDGQRGALVSVLGGKDGASSTAQGSGGLGKSNAQVVLSSDTGDTLSSAQTSGLSHGTQTQVQASEKGGLSNAQANGPGSTSSQAQIGFSPYDGTETDDQDTPFKGGGTAAAQSGTHAGMTQTQIQGKFRYGIKYTGASQASSGTHLRNFTDADGPFKPINFTIDANKSVGPQRQSQKVAVDTIKKPSAQVNRTSAAIVDGRPPDLIQAASTTSTDTKVAPKNPKPDVSSNKMLDEQEHTTIVYPEYSDGDFGPEEDDYEDEEVETEKPAKRNLITQTSNRQRQHIILDPLEDFDATVHQSKGDFPDDGAILQPGQRVPSSGGYQIPPGFRGKVKSIANGRNTYAIGQNSQAQSVTLSPGSGRIIYRSPVYSVSSNTVYRNGHGGYGGGYTYQPAHQSVRYGLKNGKVLPNFVSVSKSETGSKDLNTGQKTPSVYYTQSSTCGMFTNSCVFSGGKKLCYPKPKTNPDGSLMVC